jgi:hypothetical protein
VPYIGQLEGDWPFKTTEGRRKDKEQDYQYPMGAKITKGLTSVRCESDFIFNQYSQSATV